MRFCLGGEQGTLLNNTTATLRSEQDRLFFFTFRGLAADLFAPEFFFLHKHLSSQRATEIRKKKGPVDF